VSFSLPFPPSSTPLLANRIRKTEEIERDRERCSGSFFSPSLPPADPLSHDYTISVIGKICPPSPSLFLSLRSVEPLPEQTELDRASWCDATTSCDLFFFSSPSFFASPGIGAGDNVGYPDIRRQTSTSRPRSRPFFPFPFTSRYVDAGADVSRRQRRT